MEFEKIQTIEKIGKNRERLLELEKTGNYVFHGSQSIIEILEPRQAGGHSDETGKWEDDGKPAVFATPYADLAIFRSLINDKDFENKFGMKGDGWYVTVDKKLIERAKDRIGKVYVLDKSKFNPDSFIGIQCRSEESVIPLEVIEVNIDDLPKDIEIVE
ncbi:MAG: hypothetical protein WC022_04045 [Parcubacteria group bacterium]